MKRPGFGMRRGATRAGLFLALTAAALACGSAGEEPTANAPTPGPTPTMSAPETSTPAPTGAAGATGDTPAATETTSPVSRDPAAPDPSEATDAVNDGCTALGSTDACAACICERCGSELQTCVETDGCPEILVCVRESACSGRSCFCGDASLTECLRGEANGPCRDVILAAPGGRTPSAQDPSAGPASDAALRVGECADDDDECSELCAIED
jgi:hypothetical protein